MSIEVLWIIPIVAIAMLVLLLLINIQKAARSVDVNGNKVNLNREVKEFNSGKRMDENVQLILSETRLHEMENTIHTVSNTLSDQQKIIEKYRGKDIQFESGLNELKKKLESLQHEYAIAVLENSLFKRKLQKLEQSDHNNLSSTGEAGITTDSLQNYAQEELEHLKATQKIINIKKFNDISSQPTSKLYYLDDTSEINISELK